MNWRTLIRPSLTLADVLLIVLIEPMTGPAVAVAACVITVVSLANVCWLGP